MSTLSRKEACRRRHRRVRGRVSGTAAVPRLCVCRTGQHLYVQFVDDEAQRTLAAVSSLDPEFRKAEHKCDKDGAAVLGRMTAERARAVNIKRVVFDRGGFRYHGRIRALADAAREGGLEF